MFFYNFCIVVKHIVKGLLTNDVTHSWKFSDPLPYVTLCQNIGNFPYPTCVNSSKKNP